jgi:hypothetical protein
MDRSTVPRLFPPLFDNGRPASLSPSIQAVEFHRCNAPNNDRAWLYRAASALKDVQRLSLVMSSGPFANLLDRLPKLRGFSCLFRREAESTEMFDDFQVFDELPELSYPLDTNDALARFCRVIKRPACLLDDVELDFIERSTLVDGRVQVDELKPFPAIDALLKNSEGRLVVTFGNLSSSSSVFVALGSARLSSHLQELRIRFCVCHVRDSDYASFIGAFGSKPSLKILPPTRLEPPSCQSPRFKNSSSPTTRSKSWRSSALLRKQSLRFWSTSCLEYFGDHQSVASQDGILW